MISMFYKEIAKTSIQAGDVLLCYSSDLADKSQEGIIEHGYSHAAICLNSADVLEATKPVVRKTTIDQFFDDGYQHIAVMRSEWSQESVQKLLNFANLVAGLKFNEIGIARCVKRKDEKNSDITFQKVIDIMNGAEPESPLKNTYFCSELVVAAFLYKGVASKEATPLFKPNTFSPEGIAIDKAFGFFHGYILPYNGYIVPDNDYFRTSI